MSRLLFEKKENAVWISHLDLMRVFQRAFKRAGLSLKHTQGFNPRPSVSIALPLSVGIDSGCELLDFDIEETNITPAEICERLNAHLVAGVRVLEAYSAGRKIRELTYLHCNVTLEYDHGVPQGAVEAICALFSRNSLIVPKKTKSGIQDQDIIPMIRRISVTQNTEHIVRLDALVCCQNPTLNPVQLSNAILLHLPEFKFDFAGYSRLEIFDNNENIFR